MSEKKQVYPPYPEYPYSPPIQGLFHNQIPLDTSVSGQYSVYIPADFQPCSPAVVLLPPANTSAQAFLESETGQDWFDEADASGIALVVAEPYDAGVWNVENAVTLRDDESYLYAIWNTINKKFTTVPAAFDLDERSLYLVGYERGGTAAHKMAMLWPSLFAGLVSVGGSDVPDSVVSSFGEKASFPFAQSQNSDGHENLSIPNNTIPVPTWMIATSNAPTNSEAVKNHWVAAAAASPDDANDYAQETYANDTIRIWLTAAVTGDAINARTIYGSFLSEVQRFPHKPGGMLYWRIKFENQDGKGFFFTETEIHGFIRRWWTYVPTTLEESKEHPLVIAMHGGSSSAEAFAGDSRWHDAAEKFGLIVVYPQGYPCPLPAIDWIPTPIWNQYIVVPSDAPDDVAFIREIIARTKQTHRIDARRIYATGHSNGAGMSWRLGLDTPESFTAIAPAGYTLAATPGTPVSQEVALENPLPVWTFMGRFDAIGGDEFREGNWNDTCMNYWGVRDGFDPSILRTEYDETGRIYIRTWTNGSDAVPIFRYASVADLPHIYLPAECDLLWQDYFSKITLEDDGKRYYDGQVIVRG